MVALSATEGEPLGAGLADLIIFADAAIFEGTWAHCADSRGEVVSTIGGGIALGAHSRAGADLTVIDDGAGWARRGLIVIIAGVEVEGVVAGRAHITGGARFAVFDAAGNCGYGFQLAAPGVRGAGHLPLGISIACGAGG